MINKPLPHRTAGAIAQRASDILGNLPPAGDLLTVVHYFPEHSSKQFPGGDVVSWGAGIRLRGGPGLRQSGGARGTAPRVSEVHTTLRSHAP